MKLRIANWISTAIFEVHSKGSGLFSYILSDNAFRISLSGMGAKQTPLAYVQIKSDWLVYKGVLEAVTFKYGADFLGYFAGISRFPFIPESMLRLLKARA